MISKLNGLNQCTPLCRCGSPTRAQVSRQRPSPSMPIHRASARCAARRNGAQPCRSAGCALCAASQNLKAAYRLGPPTCLQRAAMRGCTARPVRRQLRRARRRHTGSASRAGPNFAEVQGCVHATHRAQSGLGSASRPAYSSIRCEAAAQAANRRSRRLWARASRPAPTLLECDASPRASHAQLAELGVA